MLHRIADRVSAEPRGRVRGSAILPQLVLSSMRTVAAVIALVACVHAGLWALTRETCSRPQLRRPARQRFLRAVRELRQSRRRRQGAGRANPRRSQNAGAVDARGPHLFVDRRRRARARHRVRIRPARHGRRLDRQAPGPQRARNPLGHRPRQTPQQRQRHHRRQRNDLSAASRRSPTSSR